MTKQMVMLTLGHLTGSFEYLIRSAKTGCVIDLGNHYGVYDWGLTDKGIIIVRTGQNLTFTFISYDGNTKRVIGRFPSVYYYKISASGLFIHNMDNRKYYFDESGFNREGDENPNSTIEILPPKHIDEFTEFLGKFRRNPHKEERYHRVIFHTIDNCLHLFNYNSRKHTIIFRRKRKYTFEAGEQGVVIKDSNNGLFFVRYTRPRSVIELPLCKFDEVGVCPFGVVIQHHNNFSLVVVK